MPMPSLKNSLFPLILALTSVGAAAEPNPMERPCTGAEIELTDARQQQYADLIAHTVSEGLEPATHLRASEITIDRIVESQGWTAIQGSVPIADSAVFFFETVDGIYQFRDVWGGWVDSSIQNEMEEWMKYLGTPESISACIASLLISNADSDQLFGFSINIAYTVDTLDILTEREEEVVVSASYYGFPSPAGRAHVDDVGRVALGTEDIQVPAEPGLVEITGNVVDKSRLRWIEGDVFVNVNLHTARLSSDDNLITCDFIDAPLAEIVAVAAVSMRCALVEEGLEAQIQP